MFFWTGGTQFKASKAAILAALGTSLSEVGAIVIVGGNVYGYDQTLASAALYEAKRAGRGTVRTWRRRPAMIARYGGAWSGVR